MAISAGSRWEDYGTSSSCWLSTNHGVIWAFIAPMLVIVVVNVYVFIRIMHAIFVIAARIRSRRSNKDESETLAQLKKGIKASASFLSLLGLLF